MNETGQVFDPGTLRRKPAAILGAGVSGDGAGTLLRALEWEYQTYDERGRAFGLAEAQACSVVVVSPGFEVDHPWLVHAREAGVEIFGEADFASAFWPGPVVAVTGTNGKTTLARFIERLLREAGRPARALGNVGESFSAAAAEKPEPDETAVLELSSFQTETLRLLRPDAVVWTNFAEDHLDRHRDLSDYFRAKARLVEALPEGGTFLAGASVRESAEALGLALARSPLVARAEEAEGTELPAFSPFRALPQRETLALGLAFAREAGIGGEAVKKALAEFRGDPHRMEKVATVGRTTFWNDSKATNFAAALAACRHFAGKALWIGGGKDKGGDLAGFARRLRELVAGAYLVGETGPALGKLLAAMGSPVTICENLAKAVKAAYDDARDASDVLFSPGFASLDSFSGYEERGKTFVDLVLNLKSPARGRTPSD